MSKFDGLVQDRPRLSKFTVVTDRGSLVHTKAVDATVAASLIGPEHGGVLFVFKGLLENQLK